MQAKAKSLRWLGEGKKLADADNKSIIEALKNSEGTEKLAELFKKADNPWVKKAKTLNSRFTALSVLVLVPVFLGFMLPAINERATKKRIREEQAAAEAQKTSAINNQNFMPKAPKVFDEINPFVKK